jgi:hypothetical protein
MKINLIKFLLLSYDGQLLDEVGNHCISGTYRKSSLRFCCHDALRWLFVLNASILLYWGSPGLLSNGYWGLFP